MWAYITDKSGIGGHFIIRYVSVFDESYCVGPLDATANALREASKFVCGGSIPDLFCFWLSDEFSILHTFPGVGVDNRGSVPFRYMA